MDLGSYGNRSTRFRDFVVGIYESREYLPYLAELDTVICYLSKLRAALVTYLFVIHMAAAMT